MVRTVIFTVLAGWAVALLLWLVFRRKQNLYIWQTETQQMVALLEQSRPGSRTFDRRGLPPLVRDYFEMTLPSTLPTVRTVSMVWSGEFRIRPGQRHGYRFQARQTYSLTPPGFVWDARISIAPGISIRVRDAYAKGRGQMKGVLLSLFPVIDVRNRPELDEAALQRYLAEAVWFPMALLPATGVYWQVIAPRRATASYTDAGIDVSLNFTFNEHHAITEVFVPERYREVGGKYEKTPWRGRYYDYQEFHGFRVPARGEIAWQFHAGEFVYWKGRVENLTYR